MKFYATHEPASVSCRSLTWLLEREADARKRELYLLDLVHKSIPLNAEGRSEALMRGFSTLLSGRVQASLNKTMEKQMN